MSAARRCGWSGSDCRGGDLVAEPLPTLAEIDHLLSRSVMAEDLTLAEIADLWEHVEEVREKRDALLVLRFRVAGLRSAPA